MALAALVKSSSFTLFSLDVKAAMPVSLCGFYDLRPGVPAPVDGGRTFENFPPVIVLSCDLN